MYILINNFKNDLQCTLAYMRTKLPIIAVKTVKLLITVIQNSHILDTRRWFTFEIILGIKKIL